MASNDYHFVTQWRLPGPVEEISDVLGDAEFLPRWWPAVYLEVTELEPGDADAVGKVVDLYTKGWLPYTLRWQFRVTESRRPFGFSLEAWGDFVGSGVWTFEPDGDHVTVTYDWRIRADKPLLRTLSFVLKPLFAANHHWAMARGEESLKLELARRRMATTDDATTEDVTTEANLPSPPGPTPSNWLDWLRHVLLSR